MEVITSFTLVVTIVVGCLVVVLKWLGLLLKLVVLFNIKTFYFSWNRTFANTKINKVQKRIVAILT